MTIRRLSETATATDVGGDLRDPLDVLLQRDDATALGDLTAAAARITG